MDAEKQMIEIGLSLPPNAVLGCPACKSRMHIKEWRERSWRNLDSCQFKTVLKARVPVVECQENGSQTVQVPWAEGKSRFTLFFARLAIEVLLACNANKAAELLEKATRPLWLWGEVNLPQCHAARFEELKQSNLRTARAWRLKELWRTFKQCINVSDDLTFFHEWYVMAIRSKLEPIKAVARTMKDHLAGIVSIFTPGFCNAMTEGVNSRIQVLVQKSCGCRNMDRLKIDIFFHFGGLNLNPFPAQ